MRGGHKGVGPGSRSLLDSQSARTLVLYFLSYRTVKTELFFFLKATQSVVFVTELELHPSVKKVTVYVNLMHSAVE